MPTTLIVPGLKSSGPMHWQTWLERRLAGSVRVNQRDWNDPHLPDWSSRVRWEIARSSGPIFIVAHSFGALAAVQAASDHADRIAGALLVAPADPRHFGVAEFLPIRSLGFAAIVVASTNDPWISLDIAAHWANPLGRRFHQPWRGGTHQCRVGLRPLAESFDAARATAARFGISFSCRTACCVELVPRASRSTKLSVTR